MQNIGRFAGVEYMEGISFHSSKFIEVRFYDVHDYPELVGAIGDFVSSFTDEPTGIFLKLIFRWISHDDLQFKQAYVRVEVLESLDAYEDEDWAIKNIDVDLTEGEVKGILKIVADGIRNELEDNFLV